MLTPWDDYPIHADADPVATPSSADPNHYDRYFFNGHERDGAFYLGGAWATIRCSASSTPRSASSSTA